jgi:hypothetical protein
MKIADFLAEMPEEFFPQELGPDIRTDSHDPPFTKSVLRRMEKSGIIVMIAPDRYCLTLKATAVLRKGA